MLCLALIRRGDAIREERDAVSKAARASSIPAEILVEQHRYDAGVVDELRRLDAKLQPDIGETHHTKSHGIAASSGGVPEIAREGDTALLVRARDEAGMACALDVLLADSGRAALLGAAARASVSRTYTPELQASRLSRLYATLATEAAARSARPHGEQRRASRYDRRALLSRAARWRG